MNQQTKFEDLSTEIIIEILDYLHAIDIFVAFGSLNRRIFSILRSVHLNVIITSKHHPWHIELLSSHLINHADQVISLSIDDDTLDCSSAIGLLFERHMLDNLRSCRLRISCSFYELKSFIRQLENLTNLRSLYIIQPHSLLSQSSKYDSNYSILSRMRSTVLRSVGLLYHYDHCGTLNANNTITSNLTYLELMLHTSSDYELIYSLMHILGVCPVLKRLRLVIRNGKLVERSNAIVPSSWVNNVSDVPILSDLTFFNLHTVEIEDVSFLERILDWMPNLVQFTITFMLINNTSMNIIDAIDGYFWEDLLSRRAPRLCKFDFFISAMYNSLELVDLDDIIDSFEYFLGRYDGWHMAASRWFFGVLTRRQQIYLRTLNYSNELRCTDFFDTIIVCGTFEMRSTLNISDCHHTFYAHNKHVRVLMTTYANSPDMLAISTLPFRRITYLSITFENRMAMWLWNKLMSIVFNGLWIEQRGHYDPEKYILSLSHLIDLSTITKLKLQLNNNFPYACMIEFLLLACPNLSHLAISASFLFSKRFLGTSSLISVFNRLPKLELLRDEDGYFLVKHASKLVQHFPSLVEVIVNVYSFDHCVEIIDILLTGLSKLVYVKVNFHRDTLLDDPFTSDYVIEKRRQSFDLNRDNDDHVTVQNDGSSLIIWLE